MTLRRDDSTTDVEIHGLEVRNELQLIGRDKIALPGEEDPHCADSSARMARFAILSFVLGSLSWLLGPLSFVPAILFGHAARRQSTEHSGGVTPLAGLILGYSFLASAVLVGALMVAGLLSREIDGFASLLEVWIGYCALGFVIAASVTCMYFAVDRPRFAIYGIALLDDQESDAQQRDAQQRDAQQSDAQQSDAQQSDAHLSDTQHSDAQQSPTRNSSPRPTQTLSPGIPVFTASRVNIRVANPPMVTILKGNIKICFGCKNELTKKRFPFPNNLCYKLLAVRPWRNPRTGDMVEGRPSNAYFHLDVECLKKHSPTLEKRHSTMGDQDYSDLHDEHRMSLQDSGLLQIIQRNRQIMH
jgi:hypothetical protein